MKSNLVIQFYYTSNFPVLTHCYKPTTFPNLFLKSSNKILCKNFLMFYLFTKVMDFKNPSLELVRSSIHTAKKSTNIFNILKAPYKNKLARNQLTTPVFKVSLKVVHFCTTPHPLANPNQFNYILAYLLSVFSSFESNVANLNKVRITFKFNVGSYWNYKFNL